MGKDKGKNDLGAQQGRAVSLDKQHICTGIIYHLITLACGGDRCAAALG